MIRIECCPPDEWPEALLFAIAHEPHKRGDAALALLANGLLDPRGLWIARDAGDIVAAQMCVLLGGAACLFWAPCRNDDIADALIRAELEWCASVGCSLAQAFARPKDRDWTTPFERAGFRRITRLEQWQRELLDPPAGGSALRFESIRTFDDPRFTATLERTYDGTLDCPELNGVRTIDQVVDGHRAQGKVHSGAWLLAFHGEQPVGLVLLVEMSDVATWELAYLGVVPEQRGRGFGRAILTHALQALQAWPATKLVLAVDERNLPARKLYASLGFVEMEALDVYLRVI
jgi:GNAT superfamily N-acetyltransferase